MNLPNKRVIKNTKFLHKDLNCPCFSRLALISFSIGSFLHLLYILVLPVQIGLLLEHTVQPWPGMIVSIGSWIDSPVVQSMHV